MNSLETLYFPDTAIISAKQASLALLFSKIHFIQLIEDDDTAASSSEATFMNSKFCQTLPVHPLGKDKERFLYLINDIKNRKDDYASQLSHVTLASMSDKQIKGDSAKHKIVSSLLGNKAATSEKSSTTEQDTLWQARLLLTIAEMLDREEEEVAQALSFLEESETGMFEQLKGRDDDESNALYRDVTKISAKLSLPKSQTVDNRLRAWFRFTRNSNLSKFDIWSTGRMETAEILFERHANEHGSQPVQLCTIELPSHIGNDIALLTPILDKFKADSSEILSTFWQLIEAAQTDISEQPEFISFHDNWQTLINKAYPVEKYGRGYGRFYLSEKPLSNYSGLKTPDTVQKARVLAVFTPAN